MSATALAAAAGLFCAALAWMVLHEAPRGLRQWSDRLTTRVLSVWDAIAAPLRRLDRGGGRATSHERRRLTLAGSAVGLVVGGLVLGPVPALVLAVAGGVFAPRLLTWRSERYRRAVDAGAGGAARALAGALTAGHSPRAAFAVAAAELDGPIGGELSIVAAQLELGAHTEVALAALRERARSHRIDMIVAAILIQRRSGGNLAELLRSTATTIAEHDRLRDEVRAASAQARFTSNVVLVMPIGGLLLGELAAPGLIGRLLGSPIAIVLLVVAAAMQLVGALLVRHFAKVPA